MNRRILGAALTVGVLTGVAKLVSLAKEVVVAGQFGTGPQLDAFLMAFLLPTIAINLLAGAMPPSLVPAWLGVREHEGADAANHLLRGALGLGLTLLVVAALTMGLLAPWLLPVLASGFSADQLALSQELLWLLLPAPLFNGMALVLGSILNAHDRFALAAITPACLPLAIVALLLAAGEQMGVYALAIGTSAGFGLELVILAIACRRRGIALRPTWRNLHPVVRRVAAQFWPLVAGMGVMAGMTLIDQAMAAMLDPGSLSTLNYGTRLVLMGLGITGMAIGTAVLPHFSRMVVAADWTGVQHTLRTYTRLLLVVGALFGVLAVVVSEPLIGLLFERDAFTAADTAAVAQVQVLFALQIPFYFASILGVRLVSSLQSNRVLLLIAMVNLPVNVVLNVVFMQWLGVAGIALSTSGVYAVGLPLVLGWLRLELRRRERNPASTAGPPAGPAVAP